MTRFCAKTIFVVAFGLTLVGILTLTYVGKVESASEPFHYMIMQSLFAVLGLVAMTVCYRVDYHFFLRKEALWTLGVGMVVALLLVLTPGVGKTIAGSRRWIGLGPVNVQPSEFVKLGVILFLSGYLGRIGALAQRWKFGIVFPCVLIGVLLVLILAQPDFGSTMIVAGLSVLMLLVGGVGLKRLAVPGALAAVAIAALLVTNENRLQRLINDHEGENYQAKQSELAFQNGGLLGVGLGRGMQKEHYLPECHTDFIYAVIAEDLGLAATGSIWVAYVAMLLCGTVIALRAPDKQGMALAFGATTLLCGQAAANIAVVTHVFPTKGLALPFLSYGGSCLLASYCAVGVLLGVGRTAAEAQDAPLPPGGRPISLS